MTITSLTFITFACAIFILYYALPKKCQWVMLLCASIFFYLFSGLKSAVYVLITATTVYAATRLMHRLAARLKTELKNKKAVLTKEEKNGLKAQCKRERKMILISTLVINIGILCVFKYFHFALAQINGVMVFLGGGAIRDTFLLIAPLGISFYTFQSIGYLVDVYWEYHEPEKNYFKVLLFVSFFPQMTQGPISEYEMLSKELFGEHTLSYKNFSWGFQRMIWGFAKKMLIADVLASPVRTLFTDYAQYSGITVLLGAFCYSVQIYADFSGYMDIMCGYCEMLGIRLTENFDRPYFSKSIEEYWRRWHMSLGAWFKKYIYYPIGMSGWSRKLAKLTKEKWGKYLGDAIPATIALVVTWLATGLWHGASWAYIVWGGVNGLFIIFSLWMKPIYARVKAGLHINEDVWLWRAFQTIRTFFLVTMIKVLPEVGTLSEGLGLWKRIFTEHTIPKGVSKLIPFVDISITTKQIAFMLCILFTTAFFAASLIQRKAPVRYYFNKIPAPLRIAALAAVALLLASFGVRTSWGREAFLYESF